MVMILDVLLKVGICYVGIKGLVFVQQIYGDVVVCDSKDFDLLIDFVVMVWVIVVFVVIGVEDIVGDDVVYGQFVNKYCVFVGDGIEIEVYV